MKAKLSLLLVSLFLTAISIAQPSGRTYGPVNKTYELPKVAGKIYFVDPDGDPNVSGTELSKPTTLETAVKKSVTGDAIILRGGIYRS